jgi:hypothetical protein
VLLLSAVAVSTMLSRRPSLPKKKGQSGIACQGSRFQSSNTLASVAQRGGA